MSRTTEAHLCESSGRAPAIITLVKSPSFWIRLTAAMNLVEPSSPSYKADEFLFRNLFTDLLTQLADAERRSPQEEEAIWAGMIRYIREIDHLSGSKKELVLKVSILGKVDFPLLYNYARSNNAIICSSASYERAWSIFSFIHIPKWSLKFLKLVNLSGQLSTGHCNGCPIDVWSATMPQQKGILQSNQERSVQSFRCPS